MIASLIASVLMLVAVAVPASGQQPAVGDKDMIKVRQDLADKFAAAIANKDVTPVAENYTADAVLQSLCPETPLAFGPDIYAKRVEGAAHWDSKLDPRDRMMSLVGTFETCRGTLKMSVHRGRPEVAGARSK
jgi:ketosteroid isomerase-like protein